MQNRSKITEFDSIVSPHLPGAYNLARWLTGNDSDAEDVVQEACVRAFRGLDQHRGGDSRAWLFAIVRNCSYSWLHRNRRHDLNFSLDSYPEPIAGDATDPETDST